MKYRCSAMAMNLEKPTYLNQNSATVIIIIIIIMLPNTY
jgi:hypothetical protein